jgi:hypothetical protein
MTVDLRQGPAAPARGSPTVYLSRAAWEHLDAAQAIVDQHAASGRGGICQICLVPDPCPPRQAAAATIGRYGQLPRRRPGHRTAPVDMTMPTREFAWFNRDLVGAR